MVSLPDNALTTLTAVADELDDYTVGTNDSRVVRYIATASSAFEQDTNRKWYWVEGYTENVEGYDTRRLVVDEHRPISSIDDITFDDGTIKTDISPSTWEIEDAGKGWIRRVSGRWVDTGDRRRDIDINIAGGTQAGLYRVTYGGGYITPQQDDDDVGDRTLPWDIEQAIIDYVVMLWHMRGRDHSISSESLLSGSASYTNLIDTLVSTPSGRIVPPTYRDAIRRYADVGMG